MSLPIARIAAVLAVTLIAGTASAGQEGTDMKLEDMGFVMRPALTPAQVERLRLLPARQFIARTKNGKRYFLYADPDYCKCVFLGDDLAMKNYRDLTAPGPLAPTTIGSDVSQGTAIVQDMAPDVDRSIFDGDILDFSY